jgi:hypothetical protein
MNMLTKREYMVINRLITEEIIFLQSMGEMGKSGIRTLQNIRNKIYRNSHQYEADKRKYLESLKQLERELEELVK